MSTDQGQLFKVSERDPVHHVWAQQGQWACCARCMVRVLITHGAAWRRNGQSKLPCIAYVRRKS